jgi:ribosomal 30S subunit maturation factor RimM
MEEEEDEQDFIGWKLYDSADEKPSSRTKPILVGTIIGIEAIPGNDLLVVERDGTEVLIPLHEDLIVSVNPKKEELLLDLPEGLY